MKVLLIDTDGLGMSLVLRALDAGHQVRWYIEPKPGNDRGDGEGFKGVKETRINNWVPHVKWADLILATSNDKHVEKLTALKKQGFPYFGPTKESAKLEISRADGMKLLEKVGIEVAPYEVFKSMEEAKRHIEKTRERYVFKTMGDNEDKSLTYVSKNAADLVAWIERMIDEGNEPKGNVMLQQFVKGNEMGVSRFMGRDGFIGPWNESFEYKKLMSGNFGPNTGEMGTVAYFTQNSKLGTETLAKLEEELVRMGHTGDVALGFMIPENGKPRPTEFTCRFGWPIENMMLGATKGDPVSWMRDALDGKDTTTFKEDIGCCLVLAHGNFPKGDEIKDVPIYGVTKANRRHLHPVAVKAKVLPDMDGDKLVRRPIWATTGNYAVVVTGFGKDVEQSTGRAYKTAEQLQLANMILRNDIGKDLEQKLPELHKQNYATHCEYKLKG